MLTAPIANHWTDKTQRPRETKPKVVRQDEFNPHHKAASQTLIVPTTESIKPRTTTDYEEGREILAWVFFMLLVLVLPAVMMLVYIFVNADAFM